MRNKLIFVSDLHLNDEFSFSPSGNGYMHAYTWMNRNIPTAASFLTWLKSREDVAELVILGDLLDGWVCPMQHPPTRDFMDILAAHDNALVIDALRGLCQETSAIEVSYVRGNHDMLLSDIFTPQNGFEHLDFIALASGMDLYQKENVLFAEHGSRFCLFNAPDTWSHPGSHLPEGFFMARVAADYAAQVGTFPDLVATLQNVVREGIGGTLPKDFFDEIRRKTPGTGNTFLMNGLDGFSPDPTYLDILRDYAGIYEEWNKRQDTIPREVAPLGDLGTLLFAASWIFVTGKPYAPRILIFGHTHTYGFHPFRPVLGASVLGCREYKHIYANTGTWVDGKTCTYVEVEPDAAGEIYFVRGFSFENAGHQTLLDEGCVRA
ncbi:MAG TPA: metallophosphoesterase [Syntrophorhabdales bacterium]|nr:metallophosphoesterase [Syntrophorhabdales bacterium]